jgi:rhodanese-related sulfurtransferase
MLKMILLVFLVTTGFNALAQDDKYKLSIDDFRSRILDDSVLLIDVRTPKEFQECRISGAANIDIKSDLFNEEAGKIDRNVPVYLYCRAGVRSDKAAKRMAELGFENVYDLDDGILGWRDEGYPIDSAALDVTH